MTRRLVLVVLLLAAAAAVTRPARAADGTNVWMTLETDHFVIHYYEPNEDIARRVAVAAERSHAVLSPALGHDPEEKTQVVVTDDTDGANGFAGVLPRNSITLFATAPSSISTLNDHDDWLYGLFAHEYTHILHLDTIKGLPRWYNKIFGKTWSPNQIQPRWFIEGIATYVESRYSSSGRNRNAIFDMFLRVPVLAGYELDLAAVTNGPLAWPHGNAAYLYGSHFLQYIADRYGEDKLRKISHDFGANPLPYGLNRSVKRAVGKDYVVLYQEWMTYLERRYTLQLRGVERRGRIEGTQLTNSGEGNGVPRFMPDGKLLTWQRSDGRSRQQYRVMPAGGDAADSKQLVSLDGAGGFSWLPDGSGMILEMFGTWRSNYDFGDLWRWDAASDKLTRLSYGLRAADPDVSRDGKWVTFTVNGRSQMRLAIMSLTEEKPEAKIVWAGTWRFDQAFSPRWSPDGKRIVFAAWTKGGYRDLWLYDVAAHSVSRLLHDRAIDADPTWSPDGELVYFTSDRTGIYNIYALEVASGELWQVTNVVNGAFAPEVSPDGETLIYSGFDGDGYELYRLPLDPDRWLAAEPYVNDRPDPTDLREDEGDVVIDGPREYRPLETLLPRRWEYVYGNDAYGTALSLSTSGSDAVGIHGWSIGASYGFTRGDVSFGASYGYNRWWPSLRFAVGRGLGRPGGLVVNGINTRYSEETWSASATMGLPVLRMPGLSADLSLTYDLDWLRNVTPFPTPDPEMAVPIAPETGVLSGVVIGWNMTNIRRYVFSLGPAEGRTVGMNLRVDHPSIGSDFHRLELSWRWQEYWQMPWRRSHILGLRYAGAIEQSDRRRDGEFALGGLPEQNIVDSIINSGRVGITYLRGYPGAIVHGHQFHLANFEYRVPILNIEWGIDTLPIYFRRLHFAALTDVGTATNGAIDPTEFKVGVGASLRLDVVFGYFAPGAFDLGVAKGLSAGGENQWWFLLTGSL